MAPRTATAERLDRDAVPDPARTRHHLVPVTTPAFPAARVPS